MTVARHELKYWCDEPTWMRLGDALAGLLALDPHAAQDHPWYTVSSLYFDTSDLAYFHDKVEGADKRGKVRLRRYDRDPSGFVELKAKRGRRIRKHRLALDAEGLAEIARGSLEPLRGAFRARSEAAARLLAEFDLRSLRPSVITRYERTAFLLADDPAVRVTLDRSLSCHGVELSDTFLREDVDRTPMRTLEVLGILEVKFSGPLPPTIGACLRRLGLVRRSISKYCLAVSGAGVSTAPGRLEQGGLHG